MTQADAPPRAAMMLPPGWATIPLREPRARGQAVRRVVSRQFASGVASPALKAQLTVALMRAAADAAKAGGAVLAIHLLAPAGVPIPITLTVFRPASPHTMAALRSTLQTTPNVVEATLDDGGSVIRRTAMISTAVQDTPEATAQFQAEYWLDPGDGAGLFHAVFTTPLVDQAETLLEMFDAIASTTRVI